MEDYEKDFRAELYVQSDFRESEEDFPGNEMTSFQLSSKIMEAFEPGFVLIASPYLSDTDLGFTIPSDIGIVLNDSIGMTRSTAAYILREIADQLDQDIIKVMNFVKEATGDDS